MIIIDEREGEYDVDEIVKFYIASPTITPKTSMGFNCNHLLNVRS
jgi:hypothetical protein